MRVVVVGATGNVGTSLLQALANDDRVANLTMTVSLGPRVRVVFKGDPLPSDRRDDLVPIAREGSADEDLLEDATNRIEDYLHAQGYRDATAPHAREATGDELVKRSASLMRGGRRSAAG